MRVYLFLIASVLFAQSASRPVAASGAGPTSTTVSATGTSGISATSRQVGVQGSETRHLLTSPTRSNFKRLGACGDSITLGAGTTAWLTQFVTSDRTDLTLQNGGYSGANSATVWANLWNNCGAYNADVVFLGQTPINDGWSLPAWSPNFRQSIASIRRTGAVPWLGTPPPQNGTNFTGNQRAHAISIMHEMETYGYPINDLHGALADDSGNYLDGLSTDDVNGKHMSQAGQNAIYAVTPRYVLNSPLSNAIPPYLSHMWTLTSTTSARPLEVFLDTSASTFPQKVAPIFTQSVWHKGAVTSKTIMSAWGGSTTNALHARVSSGGFYELIGGGGFSTITSAVSASAETPHLIAITYHYQDGTGGRADLLVDGVRIGSAQMSATVDFFKFTWLAQYASATSVTEQCVGCQIAYPALHRTRLQPEDLLAMMNGKAIRRSAEWIGLLGPAIGTPANIAFSVTVPTVLGTSTGDWSALTAGNALGLPMQTATTSVTLEGDVIGTGSGTISTVLKTSGVTAGTCTNCTIEVDSKGIVLFQESGSGGSGTPAYTTFFGSGGDGALTCTGSSTTSGPLTSGVLTRDAFWSDLTLESGCQIRTAGYRIFVRDTWDIANAPAGAIILSTGANGSNANNATGGAAPTTVAAQALPGTINGSAGASGTTTTGALSATVVAPNLGGKSGDTTSAGNGVSVGGSSISAPTASYKPMERFEPTYLYGSTLVTCGGGARGGASGGGDGTNSGRGGGSGGRGGGCAFISARVINRSSTTPAGVVDMSGGDGGNGGAGALGNVGGGAGGAGAGGGHIAINYWSKSGTASTNGVFRVHGGLGGNGSSGAGTGTAGGGANGGECGRVQLIDLQNNTITVSSGGAASAPSGTTGGAGCSSLTVGI